MKRSKKSSLHRPVQEAIGKLNLANRGKNPRETDEFLIEFAVMGKACSPILDKISLTRKKREVAERLVRQSIRLNWMQYVLLQRDHIYSEMGQNAIKAFLVELPGFLERNVEKMDRQKLEYIRDHLSELKKIATQNLAGSFVIKNLETVVSLALEVNDEALSHCLGEKKFKTLKKALQRTAKVGRQISKQE